MNIFVIEMDEKMIYASLLTEIYRILMVFPFERLNTTQQSVMYNGSRIWNELPDTIKTSPSISIFKYRLKQSLLSKYDSSDQ